MAELPDCGLYRTGISLVGHEESVPKGALVYFHNHSEQGKPLILPPNENQSNRWSFHDRGWLVEDPGFVAKLIPLLPEGLYFLKEQHLHVSREEILPEKTLLQLGYNRKGDTLLFPAKFEPLSITFPTRGYRFESPDVQKFLAPVPFTVPAPAKQRLLH